MINFRPFSPVWMKLLAKSCARAEQRYDNSKSSDVGKFLIKVSRN